MEHEGGDDTNCKCCTQKTHQSFGAESKGQVETIQTAGLLRLARILGRVLDN